MRLIVGFGFDFAASASAAASAYSGRTLLIYFSSLSHLLSALLRHCMRRLFLNSISNTLRLW